MSSTNLLALALSVTSPATPLACPASDGGVAFTEGTVFDGPVADNAVLMGDWERKIRGTTVVSWQVDYIYKAGRQVHLDCRYAQRPPLVVRIVKRVRYCRWTKKGAVRSLGCH